jgi:CBS domain containing-hemolysin-like protein
MGEIFKAGCSRIPVYGKDRDEIVGLILVKDLLFIDVDVCEIMIEIAVYYIKYRK